MPENRNRRAVRSTRAARRLRLLASVAALASAALCAAAFPGGTPPVSAVALPAHHTSRPPAGGLAASAPPVSQAGAPVAVQAVATAAGAPTRAVVPTMSMDVPIQGGLTAHQEQAVSARLVRAHKTPVAAPKAATWTPAMGHTAVARAESWLGLPYSWAGGNASGPSAGRCEPGSGGDLDCHVAGFDCSGLMMYAWGSYLSLPHLAAAQVSAGAYRPTLKQLQPGDLVFFSGYLPGGIGHVAIYAGHGSVIEAPQSGSVIRRSALADLVAADGYRGAVRPLTGPTPTLTASGAALPPAGGLVTLRGAHLASVDAVHVGGVTVTTFVQHSDTAIVLRAPAHDVGTVDVTASTSWAATSRQVTLHYAKPHPAPSAPPSVPAAPTSSAPSTPSAPSTSTPSTPVPPSAPASTSSQASARGATSISSSS